MIRGAVFDVDGVLLNSMPVWENLGELYLRRLGVEAENGLGDRLFTMSLEESGLYLKERYHLEKTPEEVTAGLVAQLKEYYEQRVPLKKGVRDFLEKLRKKDIPMVVATSGDRKNAAAALERLKVLSFFQGIFTCSEIGCGKNYPDIYYASALQLDTEPSETWVFEDTFHALRTAGKAGFRTVGVYDSSSSKDLEQIRKTADIYLPEFKNFNLFWKKASEQ